MSASHPKKEGHRPSTGAPCIGVTINRWVIQYLTEGRVGLNGIASMWCGRQPMDIQEMCSRLLLSSSFAFLPLELLFAFF